MQKLPLVPALIIAVLGIITGMLLQKMLWPCRTVDTTVRVERDTLIIRDTVDAPVPPPKEVQPKIKTDTVYMGAVVTPGSKVPKDKPVLRPDSVLEVPIERRVYETKDYRAVVSGWRPSLDSMRVYKQTQVITNTITKYKRPRWALTAGGGVGYTTYEKIVPYVGVSVGVVLWSK